MHTKRTSLAYGAEEADTPSTEAREHSESQPEADSSRPEARPFAAALFEGNTRAEPFDAAPFPELSEAGDRVRRVRDAMPAAPAVARLAERLKALADPTRLTILNALALSELRVGELAESVSMSQSAVSHQLRVLRAAQLVAVRREGKNAWYKLADPGLASFIRPTHE
jgi:DNA-binding HxlR family transcriptional regulator